MLKPAEQPEPPPGDKPIGERIHDLVDEAKAYAWAELDLAKAIALAKARALAWPAGLIFAAMLFAQAAVTVLAIGTFAALYWTFGPILAGFVAGVIFVASAGGLAWYALYRLRREF